MVEGTIEDGKIERWMGICASCRVMEVEEVDEVKLQSAEAILRSKEKWREDGEMLLREGRCEGFVCGWHLSRTLETLLA